MKQDRLNKIIADAEFAFWKAVAEACPEATSGDLPPELDLRHREVSADAVKMWVLCNAIKLPPEGARVRMTQDVDRFPHFIVKAGMTGVVEESETTTPMAAGIIVRFDQYIEGCEEWKNRVIWQEPEDVLDVPDVMEVLEAPPAPAPGRFKVTLSRVTTEKVDVEIERATSDADAEGQALDQADEHFDHNKDCDVAVDVVKVERL